MFCIDSGSDRIVGILIVQILHHTKISSVFENNPESDDTSHEQNQSC